MNKGIKPCINSRVFTPLLICLLFILLKIVPSDNAFQKNVGNVRFTTKRFLSLILKRSLAHRLSRSVSMDVLPKVHPRRFRRQEEPLLNKQDRRRQEYERLLFESLNRIGTIPATRLYVFEYIEDTGQQGSSDNVFNFEVGTAVGKVQKIFPHGKQLIVWPYPGFRNFTVDENTGVVRTSAKLNFELKRSFNMTIRDFRSNYSNPEPYRRPPVPNPLPVGDSKKDYVDHYLIVEVVDRNDNVPNFVRDSTVNNRFTGDVNTNARAGTGILQLNPVDDDSGLRGLIRFNIRTTNDKQSDFTIEPKTNILKTAGTKLTAGVVNVEVEALDYGMPPETSSFRTFRVIVGKNPPIFTNTPYNLNFSEVDVKGSVVGKVEAISRSGITLDYAIKTDQAIVNRTFAINQLGEITLLRKLDFETANSSDKFFQFTVVAREDTFDGRSTEVNVNMRLMNGDDHLGMFKIPATRLSFEEGSTATRGDDIYNVEVIDCDCSQNCLCTTGEMKYRIGDTDGFFSITNGGQIVNEKVLDYETRNFFSFPVFVTDPGKNGRTRTSYVEINVLDKDDTPPKFPRNSYEFAIFEDAPENQVVGVVQAEDPDPATDPDDINYALIKPRPAEGRQYFKVGKQGVISVRKNENKFSGPDLYEVQIEATDKGGHSSDPDAVVTIRVLDVNDHQPVFTPETCRQQEIDENLPIGTLLTTLRATDLDRGLNKEIEYSIAKVQKNNVFRINNSTGQVYTTAVLDRENYDEIFVVARATDGGSGRSDALRQVGYCQFIVKVKDVNDHYPKFDVQTFDVVIQRRLAVGSTVLLVEASDPDLGQNAIINYKIVTQKVRGNDVDYLEVVQATGEVRVKNSMAAIDNDRTIVLVIEATNTVAVVNNVQISSESRTTVQVKFSSSGRPNFGRFKFTANAREDVEPSSVVLTLPNPNDKTVFSLQTLRDRDQLPFFVGASDGNIRTSKKLDYETVKSYLFAVTAKFSDSRGITSLIIQINVTDVDDNVPIFGNDRYEATVSEAAGGNINVFRVQASDPDPIQGDKLLYRIQQSFDYESFAIEDKNNFAQIKTAPTITKGFFDRETKSVYTIIIEAYRANAPNLLSTAVLSINVRDENDSPPVFVKNSFSVSVAEDVSIPYVVPNVIFNATDADILENGEVFYFLTSGNDGRFAVETIVGQDRKNTGKLRIIKALNAKKSPEFFRNPVYTLIVTATDRKHTANATINVRVLDRPDSKPEFLKPYYEKYLPENAASGLTVVMVEVKKPDDPNAVIRFRLDNKAKSYFKINETSGLITTAGNLLDWEVTPVITFPVYAFDIKRPALTGQTFVRVVVNDVNDASPLFQDQPYIGYIKENSPPGTLVRYINAIDKDNPDVNDGKNVKLTYELLTNTGQQPFDKDAKLFTLDKNGRLVSKQSINAEEFRRNLSIRVRAWDEGNPRLWGKTDVTIVIRDVGEYPAWFRKREYEATVPETSRPGFVVLQLTTKDRDFSPPNNYAFSILSGNVPYAFDINQRTGEIVVSGVLDYDGIDAKTTYTLTVGLRERSQEQVISRGIDVDEAFEDTATVTIKITQGNDNKPTFRRKIYSAIIPEDTPVGTRLDRDLDLVPPLNIEAQDNDKGFSDQFRFYIKSGNVGDWFGVEKVANSSNKADVFIQYPLDREFQENYQMQLVVEDGAFVYDTAWLRITLTDVNDNPPRFLKPYYTAKVKAGRCEQTLGSGNPLATLTVVDDDQQQGPFTFTVIQNTFTLQQGQYSNTTQLYCTGQEFLQDSSTITVEVQARDNLNMTSTKVFITVTDANGNSGSQTPQKLNVIINAVNGKFVGGRVAKIYSSSFPLSGVPEDFLYDPNNGWISARSTVKVGLYKFDIPVGTPSYNVEVTVRNIPQEAINNSATLQLYRKNNFVTPSSFFNPLAQSTLYQVFEQRLSTIFDVPLSDVFIFSIQTSKMEVKPRRSDPAIDVHFAIKKKSSARSEFLPRWSLINMLERKRNETVAGLGLDVSMIGLDYCAEETTKSAMCRNIIRRQGDQYTVIASDYRGITNNLDYAYSMTSINLFADAEYDRYHQDPDPEYDLCSSGISCLNGGTCHNVVPRGFVCECPSKYSGPRCQMTTRTFKKNSYIWLSPKTPHVFGSVSLEFATRAADGLLLYQGPAVQGGNNNISDFLAISLEGGFIKVGVSFGWDPVVIYMNKTQKLNNMKWHHVDVSHKGKEIKVIIDHCMSADMVENGERIVELRQNCEIVGKTKRNFQFLNGLGPMQIGGIEGMPLQYPHSNYTVYKYFHGCIRKITENLEMYDLSYPLKVVNAPEGCTLMASCIKCKNNGYCVPGAGRSTCACPPGYVGDDCSGIAPRFWYKGNSFTEYVLPGEERRRKRAVADEPGSFFNRFSNYITMQIRLDPGVKTALFFYMISQDGREYSRLGYEEQKLYFEFKLLDALVRLEMDPRAEVDDGNWHTVVVSRQGNYAVLQIDYAGRVSRNTGGMKQLIRMGSSKINVGGLSRTAPSPIPLKKIVRAPFTDVRFRRSAGTILGVTTDGRTVTNIAGDMKGCLGSTTFNGRNLDAHPDVKKIRFNVKKGCPCTRQNLFCRNGGKCVDAAKPYCKCTFGWSGSTCENIVYVAPVLGNFRASGRARWEDGGVLIIILVIVLCVLLLALILVFIKKQREAPHSVPVGDEGQDSIMPYHDDGAGEEDTYDYDMNHLMKYSYRDGHGTVSKHANGKEPEQIVLLNRISPDAVTSKKEEEFYKSEQEEAPVFWPFILNRIDHADEDISWWPRDEMRHWEDEGDEGEPADLSEIEDNDDEDEEEQDWEFLKDWGRKFENLNKIFNPVEDDDDDDYDDEEGTLA